MKPQFVATHNRLADTTANMVLTNDLEFGTELLDAIFESKIDENKKLEILIRKIDHIEIEEIIKLLAKLNVPYSEIAEHGNAP